MLFALVVVREPLVSVPPDAALVATTNPSREADEAVPAISYTTHGNVALVVLLQETDVTAAEFSL